MINPTEIYIFNEGVFISEVTTVRLVNPFQLLNLPIPANPAIYNTIFPKMNRFMTLVVKNFSLTDTVRFKFFSGSFSKDQTQAYTMAIPGIPSPWDIPPNGVDGVVDISTPGKLIFLLAQMLGGPAQGIDLGIEFFT